MTKISIKSALVIIFCNFVSTFNLLAKDYDQGLYIELNKDGLRLFASEVQKSALQDLVAVPLPDYSDTVDYGIQAEVHDVQVWVGFDQFHINAQTGYLLSNVDLLDVRVRANQIKFKKKVLGGTLRTTCYNTVVHAGHARPLTLKTNIYPRVENHKIGIVVDEINFDIPEDNFKVEGPERCSGDLGIGSLIKGLVKKFLKDSRKNIEEKLREKVRTLAPAIEQKLNELSAKTFAIRLLARAPLPAISLDISTQPSLINTSPEGIRLVLRANLQTPSFLKPKSASITQAYENTIDHGRVGIDPHIFGELVFESLGRGTTRLEISEKQVPSMKEILNVRSAAAIWPDLLDRNLTADSLKAFLSIETEPQMIAVTGEPLLKSILSNINLDFYAPIDDKWLPYFRIKAQLELDFRLDIADNKLRLKLDSSPKLIIEGQWNDQAEQLSDLFESDLAEVLLTSVFDYIYESGSLAMVTLPIFKVGDQTMGLSSITGTDQYLTINFGNL